MLTKQFNTVTYKYLQVFIKSGVKINTKILILPDFKPHQKTKTKLTSIKALIKV